MQERIGGLPYLCGRSLKNLFFNLRNMLLSFGPSHIAGDLKTSLSRLQLIAMSHILNYPQIRRKELPASYEYHQPSQKSNERVRCLSEAKYQEWSITTKSKPLRNNGRKVLACIVDGICMLLCVATFAFAMLVYRANNTVMDSYHWRLLDAAKIVSIHCAFPNSS